MPKKCNNFNTLLMRHYYLINMLFVKIANLHRIVVSSQVLIVQGLQFYSQFQQLQSQAHNVYKNKKQ